MNNNAPMFQARSVQQSMNNSATQFRNNNAALSWRQYVMDLALEEELLEVIALEVAPVVKVVAAVETLVDLAGQNLHHQVGGREAMEKDQLPDQERLMEVQEMEGVVTMTFLLVAPMEVALEGVTREVQAALEGGAVLLEVLAALEAVGVDMEGVLEVDQEVVVDKLPNSNVPLFRSNNVKMYQDNNAKQ